MRISRSMHAVLATILVISAPSGRGDAAARRPVLLELFTSEGCSSCPPADAYVGSLEGRGDVLALTFHVDYWDDQAWTDRLSSPDFTRRQRDYGALIGSSLYTPQLVVDGREDVVGSDRGAAEHAIRTAQHYPQTLAAAINRGEGNADISIEGAAGTANTHARILLVSFDALVTEAIHGGENGGRTVSYHNVVRSLRDVGEWRGAPVHRGEPLRRDETGGRLALIVQDASGRVLALAATP